MKLRLDRGNIRTLLVLAGCLIAKPTALTLIIGWLLIVPGAWLHLWAKGCLRQNQEVTCNGPYRWTRNPFYVANFLIDLAIAIVINQPLLFVVFLPTWFWVYRRTILEEEGVLEQLFGEGYRQYKARVPRFWPTRHPVSDLVPTAAFSWSNPNLAWGSEYARLIRVFTAPLLILVCREVWAHRAETLTAHHSLVFAAAVLLGVLTGIEWAAMRRFKRGRRLVPPWVQHWSMHVVVLAVFAAVMLGVSLLETEFNRVLLPIGLGLFVFAFLGLMLPGASRLSPAMIRWGEGAACLAGGVLAEMPWLGLLGLGYFGVLAIDATRTLTFLQTADATGAEVADRSLRTQRTLVLAVMTLLVGLGLAKEYLIEGQHPLW